jgi:CDP-glycerol glycerophosphotransferase (TagB/SpsB family)/glycosyltransferase involved in cell wall biosynthesis
MEYKYKFSVVIPVYKVEEYLEETIESVINQTIGFKDNIQMILVNDGSPDNSEAICLKYKELYPNNVIYVKQDNAGVSAARNKGFTYAEGKYTNFLDSDDKWELDVFEKVYKFFNENYDEIDIVSCRIKFFDKLKNFHPLDYKYTKNKISNIHIDYDYVQLNACSCIFKTSAIKQKRWSEDIKYTEDGKFIHELLIEKEHFGIFKDGMFYYRRRKNETSAIQTKNLSKDWLLVTPTKVYKHLFDMYKQKFGKIIPFIQYTIMYDLQWRISSTRSLILNEKEQKEYYEQITILLENIDEFIIINQKFLDIESKLFCLKLKDQIKFSDNLKIYGNFITYKGINVVELSKYPFVYFDVTKLDNNNFEIIGKFSNIFSYENVNLVFKKNKINIEFDFFDLPTSFQKKYFNDEVLVDKKGFKIKTKIFSNDKIYAYLIISKKTIKIPIFHGKFSFFNDAMLNTVYSNKKLLVTKNKKYIYFRNKNLLLTIKLKIKQYIELVKIGKIKVIINRLLSFVVKKIHTNKIWLISDRINVAGDNGEHLFKYISTIKSDKITPYFVISKKSDDYKRLKKYGRVVNINSYLYKMMFIASSKVISSHADEYVINPFGKSKKYYSDVLNFDYVFLQHGITKDDLSSWLNKYNKNIKIFVTGTNDEYKSILDNMYFYDESVVKLTGFPRFDNLAINEEAQSNKIAIMPTWRQNLSGSLDISTGKRNYNVNFKKSEYYSFYHNLISNKKLNKLIKKNNLVCEFYLHPAISEQISDFISSDSIKVINEKPNYQKIFSDYSLLITDYSSIFFDFSYLKKPIIYSQFDKETIFNNHIYDKGYFDYERDAFGDVLTAVDEVVDKIEYYIKNDFKMEEKYIKRVDNTFAYTDRNNCKRVYEEILKLDNNYGKIDKVIK